MLKTIAFSLQEASIRNNLLLFSNPYLTRFNMLSPPKISIADYLIFLYNKSKESRSCFLSAFILLDRLLLKQPHIIITPFNVHKLCLCSILIASKFLSDRGLTNNDWAVIGGVPVSELNLLELEFLFLIEFSLVISKDEYNKYEEVFIVKSKLPIFN